MWVNRILLYTVRHAEPANDHYGNATGHYRDPSACACSMYQALSPTSLEGSGNEASCMEFQSGQNLMIHKIIIKQTYT